MVAGLERQTPIARSVVMRPRLSDAVGFAFLAEQYRTHAETCRRMASVTVGPIKEGWLEFADEWTKLAREIEAKVALEQEL